MFDKEIIKQVGAPALFEGVAEEAVELAKAALKVARIMRKENPTPVTLDEAAREVVVEYSDLRVYIDILRILVDAEVYDDKKQRFIERLKEGFEE